jgi:hypothetical protein
MTTRPPIPARICNALTKLGLPLPPVGSVLPISTVDKALSDADLAKLRLLNP